MGIVEDTEQQLAVLRLRLPELEGKANKKERTAVNKSIYQLEQDDNYVSAVRKVFEETRSAAATTAAAAAESHKPVIEPKLSAQDRSAGSSVVSMSHFRNLVEELFDEYAPTFEDELTKGLNYRTPQVLEGALLALPCQPGMSEGVLSETLAVDIGCGTGLAGELLRTRCRGRLIGNDLSRGMLRQAGKKSGVYDQLSAGDSITLLQKVSAL